MPYAVKRIQKIKDGERKLVHYTSAANAIKIINSGEIWMRNSMCMADFSEVQHGHDNLIDFFTDDGRKQRFFDALNNCHDGVAQEAIKLFDDHWNSISTNTFITCVSEHDPISEDAHGRLSMWRAFGKGEVGVAFVLNTEAFLSESDVLKAYSSPVSYLTRGEFGDAMQSVIAGIERGQEFLKCTPRDQILSFTFNMLLFATTCSKHPGFLEEQEWRIIHLPDQHPSTVLKKSIETVGGIPQIVYKIPLQDIPDQGFVGAEIPKLVNKVIIGPSEFDVAVYSALELALGANGVENPGSVIGFSSIPLRG